MTKMTTTNVISKIVRLNVGGTRYDVSRATLERCEGSMLASLISDHWKEGNTDEQEPIFIDRNGRLFEYVLDYLRTNEVYLPSTLSKAALIKEFEFYGIDLDEGKVIERIGAAYCISIKQKADELALEMRAILASAIAECAYWKSSSTQPSLVVRVYIEDDDYRMLLGHEDLLRARLLDRGLEYVALSNRWFTVKVANM